MNLTSAHFVALRSFLSANWERFVDQLADEGYDNPEEFADEIFMDLDERI